MIFTDNKLTRKTVDVRFYHYSDVNQGWGDAGSYMYANFPLSAFEETEEKRSETVGGSFFMYAFNKEWQAKLVKLIGNHWWMGYGYDLTDLNKRMQEIAAAEAIIATAKTIKKFR